MAFWHTDIEKIDTERIDANTDPLELLDVGTFSIIEDAPPVIGFISPAADSPIHQFVGSEQDRFNMLTQAALDSPQA